MNPPDANTARAVLDAALLALAALALAAVLVAAWWRDLTRPRWRTR